MSSVLYLLFSYGSHKRDGCVHFGQVVNGFFVVVVVVGGGDLCLQYIVSFKTFFFWKD